LAGSAGKVVHLLRNGDDMKTKQRGQAGRTPGDFRLICDCQHHARREASLPRRSWRSARRLASQFKRSGIALLVGVPLALGVMGFPIEAMNVRVTELLHPRPLPPSGLHIFTAARTQQAFLPGDQVQQSFNLDIVKEEFFRSKVPYGAIIYREAKRNNLAPELVAAVVEAESDFRPRLVSNKNAQGLMQIIPSTGRDLGAEDLFNPAQNIAAGAKYLRYLHDRFRDEDIALAAYNAGEGNVEKFGGVPPFPETVSYLRRVSARARQYQRRVRGSYIASFRLRNSATIQ
jgi:soluble lytic murein transglycosylase-like protein